MPAAHAQDGHPTGGSQGGGIAAAYFFALGGCAGSRDRPGARHALPSARRRRR